MAKAEEIHASRVYFTLAGMPQVLAVIMTDVYTDPLQMYLEPNVCLCVLEAKKNFHSHM